MPLTTFELSVSNLLAINFDFVVSLKIFTVAEMASTSPAVVEVGVTPNDAWAVT